MCITTAGTPLLSFMTLRKSELAIIFYHVINDANVNFLQVLHGCNYFFITAVSIPIYILAFTSAAYFHQRRNYAYFKNPAVLIFYQCWFKKKKRDNT